jgi:hypothetical protein
LKESFNAGFCESPTRLLLITIMSTLELFDSIMEKDRDEATASAEGRRNPPPYFRFPLELCNGVLVPPSLPAAAMEHLPIEHWSSFWSKIEPIVQEVDGFDRYCKRLLVAYLNGLFLQLFIPGLYLLLFIQSLTAVGSQLIVGPYLFFGAMAITGRKRHVQLETLQQYCKEEEKRDFRAHGFALECELENEMCTDGVTRAHRFCVYLIPFDWTTTGILLPRSGCEAQLRAGYVRIEVLRSIPVWFGLSNVSLPVLLPSLAACDYQPTGIESLSEGDWDEFWSKMSAVSRECLPLLRICVVVHTADIVLHGTSNGVHSRCRSNGFGSWCSDLFG